MVYNGSVEQKILVADKFDNDKWAEEYGKSIRFLNKIIKEH